MSPSRLPPLDAAHPENRGVLGHLLRAGGAPPVAAPGPGAYLGAGSHPDVVERVWDQLGSRLPHRWRCLVAGTPALVHGTSGVILAAALGTTYALRLPRERLGTAEAAGLATRHTYGTVGLALDLSSFGPCWRFGAFRPEEPTWCVEAAEEVAG